MRDSSFAPQNQKFADFHRVHYHIILEHNDMSQIPLRVHSQDYASRHAAICRLIDLSHSIRRAGTFLDIFSKNTSPTLDFIVLSRLRNRVRGFAQLLSAAAKEVKVLGYDKNTPFIHINGQFMGFQDATRLMRSILVTLDEKQVGDPLSEALAPLGFGDPGHKIGDPQPNKPPEIDLTKPVLFDDKSDDKAREIVFSSSPKQIQQMEDYVLIRLINDMLKGPTLDEDEAAILKILESCDCGRRARLVDAVREPISGETGVERLLSDLDGPEWDHLVNLFVECGIIAFDKMDDDASRRFVHSHSCSQLGQLDMGNVRQLILNMFSGSCGDDDEDAILALIRCQSTLRLQQLVGMPGTDVGEFDYNFDGDQWDDLDAFFAANGIRLNP